jgi:hypothetical protein
MTASIAPVALFSFRSIRKAESSSVIRPESTLTGQIPAWFDAVARKCVSFVELENNWDSYGGRPVHESIAQAAANLIVQLVRASVPEPTVVPTSGGGIQLEWHTTTVDLEIELASAGRISAVFEDRTTGREWEHEFQSDLSLLVEAVGQLSESR